MSRGERLAVCLRLPFGGIWVQANFGVSSPSHGKYGETSAFAEPLGGPVLSLESWSIDATPPTTSGRYFSRISV